MGTYIYSYLNAIFNNEFTFFNIKAKQEWKYTALVIDRLLLFVFTTSCIVGTIAIILQAPSFYDQTVPIDQQMSRNF